MARAHEEIVPFNLGERLVAANDRYTSFSRLRAICETWISSVPPYI